MIDAPSPPELANRSQLTAPLLGKLPRSGAQRLLQELLASCLIRPRDWEALPPTACDDLTKATDQAVLLDLLEEQHLLNNYQADRVRAGTTFGLILGNYRVLRSLGAGGMGIVFQAEHLRLPRLVAIKVLTYSPD